METRQSAARQPQPANPLSDFIAQNIARGTAGQTARNDSAAALLDAQALAFLSSPRLRHVLENWYGLRLLRDVAGTGSGVEVTLLQLAINADGDLVRDHLAGEDGALHEELYDILLFANRCPATADGPGKLQAIAEAAEAFDIVAFATLDPDIGKTAAERVAAMDAPHQVFDGAGFEAFNALRTKPLARRLCVMWNDVLAAEGSSYNPELFIPAAWVAATMMLRSVSASGWPSLKASVRDELAGFAVATHASQGREIATATRALATEASIASLASIGIATLNGGMNRDSVRVAHAPLFSAGKADAQNAPSLDDQLVLARLNQLLQSLLPGVLGQQGTVSHKAEELSERLSELARSITESPRFSVDAVKDEDGNPLLDITASMPEGVAAGRSFGFQIPC